MTKEEVQAKIDELNAKAEAALPPKYDWKKEVAKLFSGDGDMIILFTVVGTILAFLQLYSLLFVVAGAASIGVVLYMYWQGRDEIKKTFIDEFVNIFKKKDVETQ